MLFKAFVKDKETGESKFLEYDYDRKSDFINDLKQNGYSVHRVEPKELYDFVLKESNGDKYDWEAANKLYKAKKPLTKENLSKAKSGEELMEEEVVEKDEEPKYEIVNDERIDAIKDNFTPPGAKNKEPKIEKPEVKDIDTNDNGKVEVDELSAYTKDLEDYLEKNPKAKDKNYY